MRASATATAGTRRVSPRTAKLLALAIGAAVPHLLSCGSAYGVEKPVISRFDGSWVGATAPFVWAVGHSNWADYNSTGDLMHYYIGTSTSGPWTKMDSDNLTANDPLEDLSDANVSAENTTYYGWMQAEDPMSNLSDPSDIWSYNTGDNPYT